MFSQDIQFSQFYAAPLYLNPAFAGSSLFNRIVFQQRLQWPALDARYTTSLLSFDAFSQKYRSGIGVMAIRDVQGRGTISSTEFSIQYSYDLSISNSLAFRPGLHLGYISRTIDYSQLHFPDQYDDQGLNGNGSTDPLKENRRKGLPDVGAGGVFYSKHFWISYAGHHLNTPNQAFQEMQRSVLPAKHSFTAGYKFIISQGGLREHMGHMDNTFFIIPTVHYKFQGMSDQTDAGLYILYNEILFGIWYRGIPFKRYESRIQNNEAIIGIIGWRIRDFRLSYSYDFTVSRLHTARTAGAHELNITYLFKKKKGPMKVLPCPTF